MARTPNDDRSDSMNPNNPAYDASLSNHYQQIDTDDDDAYAAPITSYERAPCIVQTRSISTELDIVFPVMEPVKSDPKEAAALNKAFPLETGRENGFCLKGSEWYKATEDSKDSEETK